MLRLVKSLLTLRKIQILLVLTPSIQRYLSFLSTWALFSKNATKSSILLYWLIYSDLMFVSRSRMRAVDRWSDFSLRLILNNRIIKTKTKVKVKEKMMRKSNSVKLCHLSWMRWNLAMRIWLLSLYQLWLIFVPTLKSPRKFLLTRMVLMQSLNLFLVRKRISYSTFSDSQSRWSTNLKATPNNC